MAVVSGLVTRKVGRKSCNSSTCSSATYFLHVLQDIEEEVYITWAYLLAGWLSASDSFFLIPCSTEEKVRMNL
jgi:hypothetical protein